MDKDRKPLETMFVGDGKYVVMHGGLFGPFHSEDVAGVWARDVFGSNYQVLTLEWPWVVPPDERKGQDV